MSGEAAAAAVGGGGGGGGEGETNGVQPNVTIYINNLNEKIKLEGLSFLPSSPLLNPKGFISIPSLVFAPPSGNLLLRGSIWVPCSRRWALESLSGVSRGCSVGWC